GQLPLSLENAVQSADQAAFQCHFAVENRRGVAGSEDEEISGSSKSEISQRQQIDRVVGDVIDKDEPVRDPEHEKNAKITAVFVKGGLHERVHVQMGQVGRIR